MAEMELLGIKLELPSNTPIVLLRETEGQDRVLPIFIGLPEANAIHLALEGREPPRPLTHDLLIVVVNQLGGAMERVTITELREGTFYAELSIRTAGGTEVISCRPSDGIALAVRSGMPIFASSEVLDEAAAPLVLDEDSEENSEEVVEEFREFIEKVNPDDFAS